jgi:hypothetical protein
LLNFLGPLCAQNCFGAQSGFGIFPIHADLSHMLSVHTTLSRPHASARYPLTLPRSADTCVSAFYHCTVGSSVSINFPYLRTLQCTALLRANVCQTNC